MYRRATSLAQRASSKVVRGARPIFLGGCFPAMSFPKQELPQALAVIGIRTHLADAIGGRRFLSTSGSDQGDGQGSDDDQEPEIQMPDQESEMKLVRIQTSITSQYQEGNYREALKQSEELLKQTEKHFGRKHPATASAYNNCGLFHKLMGDFVPARKNYSQAQRIYGQVVGRDHASYALTMHNLGALNQSQVHFDTSLKATERLGLVEKALEYFQEAFDIRMAELGEAHPHTIATQSAYGSTLAAQVLHQHKLVEEDGKRPKTGELKSRATRQYISLNPDALTERAWDAAESHLRKAMDMAIANPRGQSIQKKKKKSKGKKSSKDPAIHTLSAASAAQHLAVFLKSRSMTQSPYDQLRMDEAKDMYQQVLNVRKKLLPQAHPDLYATQYSLAELLEAIGDEDAANAIRQEILDTYDPQEVSEEIEVEETPAINTPPIVVEKTMAGSKPH